MKIVEQKWNEIQTKKDKMKGQVWNLIVERAYFVTMGFGSIENAFSF